METSTFALPLLVAGQAQKEISHNEALTLIDALLTRQVEGIGNNAPADPLAGAAWIVGDTPTGIWAGQAGRLALFIGYWRFIVPRAGFMVQARGDGRWPRFDGSAWRTPRAIMVPQNGATVDAECRAALAEMHALLRDYGIAAA